MRMKMSCRRMNLFLKTTNHLYYAFLNCNYGILFACFWYRHRLTRFVHMRTRYSNISCARLVIESGDYFVQHIQKYGDNLRVVTNWAWRLIERGVWSSVASDRANTVPQSLWQKFVWSLVVSFSRFCHLLGYSEEQLLRQVGDVCARQNQAGRASDVCRWVSRHSCLTPSLNQVCVTCVMSCDDAEFEDFISVSLVSKGLTLLPRCTQGIITESNSHIADLHKVCVDRDSCSYATQD